MSPGAPPLAARLDECEALRGRSPKVWDPRSEHPRTPVTANKHKEIERDNTMCILDAERMMLVYGSYKGRSLPVHLFFAAVSTVKRLEESPTWRLDFCRPLPLITIPPKLAVRLRFHTGGCRLVCAPMIPIGFILEQRASWPISFHILPRRTGYCDGPG